jgi:hypothetical protein
MRFLRMVVASRQPLGVIVTPLVLATVEDARVRIVDGIVSVRQIHFVNGISCSVTVRYIDCSTGLQIGGDFSGGPGVEVNLTGTAVDVGTSVRIEYSTTTSVSGYYGVTAWRTLSVVTVYEYPEEEFLYIPKIALP